MDAGTAARALEAAILADADFAGSVVERDEFVNEDQDRAAVLWVGIYRKGVTYLPLTLAAGADQRYDVSPLQLFVVLQTVDYDSGEACGDKMEAHIKNFIDLLLGNDSLTGTVEQIKKIDIEYGYDPRSKKGELYWQTAYITLDLEVANG